MTFDRKTLVVPEKTKFEERTILSKGDVIIGDRSLIQFGIKTDGRIFVGEHVVIDGNLEATKDIRVDIFSHIGGDVRSRGNVYLGEKVKVNGKLSLHGDLDVGDSVEIVNGFEAKGWINIRSPIPMVIYIFIYLVQLLKMGHSEEIDRILEEMEKNDGGTIPISEIFLFIPNSSIIGVQKSKLDSHVKVSSNSVLRGNFDVKGNVSVGDDCTIHGSIKSTAEVICGKKTRIQGNISATGTVTLDEETIVDGYVSGGKIYLPKSASVAGMLYAKEGISITTTSIIEAEERIKRFGQNFDIIEEVNRILE